MIVVSDEKELYFLKFVDRQGVEPELVKKFQLKFKTNIIAGVTQPITFIKSELKNYFNGSLTEFKTPIHCVGSCFQKRVWEELMRVPYGQTRSYAMQAAAIGQPSAYRAVANANGANPLVIIIPCHRIINSSGNLGGYTDGVVKKQWLFNHEK